MPIYEYRCRPCGHRFEKLTQGQKQASCPSCQSTELDQLFSVFAVAGSHKSAARPAPASACGTCGDPRGPGSCSLD